MERCIQLAVFPNWTPAFAGVVVLGIRKWTK